MRTILVVLFACGGLLGDPECIEVRGDGNLDGVVNISDVTHIIDAISAAPLIHPHNCLEYADVNADGYIDMSDAYYLLAYLFEGGPPPPQPTDVCCEEK